MQTTADRAKAEQMLATARTFARERVDPEAARWELNRRLPRQAFGAPLSERQGLQWTLADVATDLEASIALTRTAAAALDTGDPTMGVRAAHAKKFATRVTLDGLAQCMQALGANGFRHDRPLARHLACAKMAHYLDGTTEIQNVVIARSLFGI